MGTRVRDIGSWAFFNCPGLKAVYFQGNAPSFGDSVFSYDNNTTVYYLPGTTGWGPMFANRPTALWNPQVQTSDANFGVRMDRFGFNITGTPDIPLVVEASINFASGSWAPLQSCTLTNGLLYFSDPHWTNYPRRFYRISSP